MTGKLALAPLSVGNTVSLGVQVWRSKFRTFFWIAIRAYLWSGPLTALWFISIAATFFASFAGLAPDLEDVPPLLQGLSTLGPGLGLVTLLLTPLALFGWAKFLTLSGLIARLSYQELRNQPESEAEARRHVTPKLTSFLSLGVQLALILVGLYFVLWIVTVIVAMILVFVTAFFIGLLTSVSSGEPPLILIVLVVLIMVATFLGLFILPFLWVSVRLMAAELPLATESQLTGSASLGRIWQLTSGAFMRLLLISTVAVILTFPIQFIVGYLPQLVLDLVSWNLEPNSPIFWIFELLSLVVSLLTGIVIGGFVLPFWQTLKAVIYFDLLNRREGLGLRLSETEG